MSDKIEGVPLGMRVKGVLCGVDKVPLHATYRVTLELEPDNVYGRPLEFVPDPPGHKRKEPLEFRVPTRNEAYLSFTGIANTYDADNEFATKDHRRIILQPPAPPQARVWLFRETGKGFTQAELTIGPSGSGGFVGTATELPQRCTPEYEALVDRLTDAALANGGPSRSATELIVVKALDDLLGGAK